MKVSLSSKFMGKKRVHCLQTIPSSYVALYVVYVVLSTLVACVSATLTTKCMRINGVIIIHAVIHK